MATSTYMKGRRQWTRPQALLFSNNPGTLNNGIFVPQGTENTDFIICSDHNRGEISMSQQRIENRLRTVNGTMRSYHTADKLNLSVSWNMLPSRAYSASASYDGAGNYTGVGKEYTADGGAGGVELLDWYENHPGPFYVYLAYDKYINQSDGFISEGNQNDPTFKTKYQKLQYYSQVLYVYFASFDYNIQKRGATNFDMWNVSLTLEEV